MSNVRSASAFLASIGVNVHVEYTDGKYANGTKVLSSLNYLGITHVRDAALNSANQGQATYDLLAAHGIKFDMFAQGLSLAATMPLLDKFAAAHPGAIVSIEGPNEVNNWPISFGGKTGDAAAIAYQNALNAAVHADTHLAGVQVLNLTSWPNLAGVSDLGNFHAYAPHGDQPYATLLADERAQTANTGSRALVETETGYSTAPLAADGVDQATQATLTLNSLMDAARTGVQPVYLYELLDAYADPTGKALASHYGLFNLDGTPKVAANAIHNLTTLLADPAAATGSVPLTSLNYTLTNLPGTGASLVLEKAGRAHDLIVWNEPDVWNDAQHTAITAAATTVGVKLGATYATVAVYDPLIGTQAIATYHNVSSLNLSITDHPLIVEVGATLATPAAATASAALTLPTPGLDQLGAALASGHFTGGTLTLGGVGGRLDGDAHVDVLYGGAGADTLNAGSTSTLMVGGLGDDSYTVKNSGDVVVELANGGIDSIASYVSYALPDYVETLTMKAGDLVGWGNARANTLVASPLGSTLYGMAGADTLQGGAGHDALQGGSGDDVIKPGVGGGATLTGGAGADIFQFQGLANFGPAGQTDVITDFSHAEHDLLRFDTTDANVNQAGLQAFTLIGASAFSHHAGELRFDVSGGNLTLSGDVNGDGVADFHLQLLHVTALTASDFWHG